MANKELGLDHFLFYDTVDQQVAESIRVQTQFEIGPGVEPETIRLTAATFFANPVRKELRGDSRSQRPLDVVPGL